MEEEQDFLDALQKIDAAGIVPVGYGVHPEELGDGYPTREVLNVGFRARKELILDLTLEIWYPRAVRWVQALDLLTRLQDEFADQ
jgi:hypothetical protein